MVIFRSYVSLPEGMVYDTYNYRIHGGYKPTFTSHLGAPHCMKNGKSAIFNGDFMCAQKGLRYSGHANSEGHHFAPLKSCPSDGDGS